MIRRWSGSVSPAPSSSVSIVRPLPLALSFVITLLLAELDKSIQVWREASPRFDRPFLDESLLRSFQSPQQSPPIDEATS
jgi:hypothetical protein